MEKVVFTMIDKYKDINLPVDVRVEDLLSRMSLKQKLSLMLDTAPAMEEFGIKRHYHGNVLPLYSRRKNQPH